MGYLAALVDDLFFGSGGQRQRCGVRQAIGVSKTYASSCSTPAPSLRETCLVLERLKDVELGRFTLIGGILDRTLVLKSLVRHFVMSDCIWKVVKEQSDQYQFLK